MSVPEWATLVVVAKNEGMKQIVTLIRPYILPVGLYGAVIALVFGRALIPGATEIIWGDDIHRSYYFYRQFFNNF